MKLRSHDSGVSSPRGKAKPEYSSEDDDGEAKPEYSSEDDDGRLPSTDSDDKAPSDEVGNTDDDKQSGTEAQEDERERYADGDNETAIGIEPGKINLPGGIAEKSGRNKKGRKKKDKPVLRWQVIEREIDTWTEVNMHIDTDLMGQNEVSMETAEPSDDLIKPLLRYQKEWLSWALKQEESSVRGGILADEMGMGKTLQAIALVLLKRSILRGIPEHDLNSSSSSSSRELPSVKCTVLICPMVAMDQWVREIDRSTLKGSTKVLVYHGAKRMIDLYLLSDHDFVITTYSIVEMEFRKYVMPPCPHCGKLFNDIKLKIHLKYSCGPNKGKCCGSKCKETENDLSTDVDDTGLISSKGKFTLHSVAWERIILDEAHYVKERRSNRTRAVLALQSRYKWALTGTPLQNRVGELYSLVRFLQIDPYSYYFCKDCDCCTLDYSISEKCPGCPHQNFQHFCWWNKYVGKPIKNSGKRRWGSKVAMILLKHKILKSSLLRRTKKGREDDLALPPRMVTLRRDSLDDDEKDYYTALQNETLAQFNAYVEAGRVSNYNFRLRTSLALLRQAVDHPYLVEDYITSMDKKGKKVATREYIKCGICSDPEEETEVTSCGHAFCKPCLTKFSDNKSCPCCSKPLSVDFTSNKDENKQSSIVTITGFRSSSITNRIRPDNFRTSTKLDALKEEIRFMIEKDGSAKGIVFSQFSPFLGLIRYVLEKCGVQCVQSDGSMSKEARNAAIKKFNEDPSCRILLMSLQSGGVALNLPVASNVFMMEPCSNPAMERQALDRIHRIGQHKPTRMVRFIMKNTVEEKILELQEKKESVFEGTVGGRSDAMAELTEEDLCFLFAIY